VNQLVLFQVVTFLTLHISVSGYGLPDFGPVDHTILPHPGAENLIFSSGSS
jgi:hypothetical protein